jgi:glycine reductase
MIMRLELRILNIKDVQFGEKTAIDKGILHINRHELLEILLRDKRLSKVSLELAYPGESCRITQISDVVEPRAKIDATDLDFPGALGKVETVGYGKTCVLRGVAVMMCDQGELTFPLEDQIGNVVDMSGPGSEVSIYSKTYNVAVLPFPADGISPDDYRVALKIAGLKTAVYLARGGEKIMPDDIEVYDLPALPEVSKGIEGLPKIAYIKMLYMNQFITLEGEPILYGDNIRKLMPTLIHPNEILDGALINAYRGGVNETYIFQQHPVITELYRRHGKDLCFAGVVLTICHNTEHERERSAVLAANLAKSVIGADGAILTKAGGGAPEIAMAQTADQCEARGVKTAVIMWQLHAADLGGALFNLPRVNVIIGTGSVWERIKLPSVQRLIGRLVTLPSGVKADGEIERIKWRIPGSTDQLGYSRQLSVIY